MVTLAVTVGTALTLHVCRAAKGDSIVLTGSVVFLVDTPEADVGVDVSHCVKSGARECLSLDGHRIGAEIVRVEFPIARFSWIVHVVPFRPLRLGLRKSNR